MIRFSNVIIWGNRNWLLKILKILKIYHLGSKIGPLEYKIPSYNKMENVKIGWILYAYKDCFRSGQIIHSCNYTITPESSSWEDMREENLKV